MKICPYCGAQLPLDVKFCTSCGSALQNSNFTVTLPPYNANYPNGSYSPNSFNNPTPYVNPSMRMDLPGNMYSSESRMPNAQSQSMSDPVYGAIGNAYTRINHSFNQASQALKRETEKLRKTETDPIQETAPNKPVVLRCQSCGATVDTFSIRCPYCGSEIIHQSRSTACQNLVNRLQQIEASRPADTIINSVTSVLNRVTKNGKIDSTDRQKMDLISNFVVPNNKADIIEFLLLAENQAEICHHLKDTYAESQHYENSIQGELEKIWKSKFQQTLRQGEILLANDPAFMTIRENYQRKSYKEQGVCQYCGGRFTGFFKLACSKCGRLKDY